MHMHGHLKEVVEDLGPVYAFGFLLINNITEFLVINPIIIDKLNPS